MENLMILSKSKLMRGLQCPKLLWLTIHKPDLEEDSNEAQQLQFDEGNEVGELARKLEGKGVMIDCEYWEYEKAAQMTSDYIKNGEKLIYCHQDTLAMVEVVKWLMGTVDK